ncbi:unnamed protein product [Durusdinium trenchii]|uniref:Uncharacterized protein n=1 Tax=Durusdinium trenchii TaxID=1381693 RepID=A0ABP0Q8U6_9DINO
MPHPLKSNMWSCESLAAGNNNLLKIKEEVAKQRAQLEAMEKDLAHMESQEHVAQPVETPMAFEEDTVPATEAQMQEAANKRPPPPSTKTTPVKSLATVKKARQDAAAELRMTSVKSKAKPPFAAETPETDDPVVRDLQKQLAAALSTIDRLSRGESVSGTPKTPTTRTSVPTPTSKGSLPSEPKSKPEQPEADAELDAADAVKRYKKIDAQLRRLCEKKPSGKLNVPMAVHELWLKGGKDRDELRVMFEQYDLNKEKFVSQVVKIIERKKEDTQKVKRGWFTIEQMKNELKWSSSYIKEVVAYCKKHGLVKNDKYSSKVFKYFVEYSETETTKKSYTEIETQRSTAEGSEAVTLSGDWHTPAAPAKESEEVHPPQAPEDGELEVENKFSAGMLVKMSKITDLISKLEGLCNEDIGEGDKDRSSKLVSSLEKKLQAAQASYDTFEDVRTRLGDVSRTPENTGEIKKAMQEAMGKASALASVEAKNLSFMGWREWLELVSLAGTPSGRSFARRPLKRSSKKAEATMAINECVGGLYKEGLFVKAPRAEYLATKGLVFLQRYRQLAVMRFRLRKKRFPLMPKGHYLHHQFLSMLHASRQGPWCINILVYANQMSEDFVGKPSRLSRRVSAKTASLRVLQRSFLAIRNSICSTLDLGDLKLGT